MSEKIVLMDGYSLLTRAFYGIPDLTNSEGQHTNAVYGFCNIMLRILEEEKPQYAAVAFDVHAPTFRKEMYDQYKGTRKGMPEELHEQVPILKDLLHAMGIPTAEQPNMEADDIIGTLSVRCASAGLSVVIISGDRDLLQLAAENVLVRIPKTKQGGTVIEDYTPADVEALYHVTPKEFIDVKALMGDASDNIPGVPGIGEKTAVAIISTFHSIENAHEHLTEIRPPRAQKSLGENYDLAVLSKTLSTIRLDCDVEFSLNDARIGNLYTEEAYEMCKKLEFKSLLNRFPDRADYEKKERHIRPVDQFLDASNIFSDAAEASLLGVCVEPAPAPEPENAQRVWKRDIARLALCFDEENIFVFQASDALPASYLEERLSDTLAGLCAREDSVVTFLNLKSALKILDIPESDAVCDLGIAAYLLNPLKNSYDYDDLARDYLGETVSSRDDLLGRSAGKLTADELGRRQVQAAAEEARICYMAHEKLMEELIDTEMLSLYRDIEMPLVWCLDRMEKEGVRVEKQELADYGSRLVGRIDELEQEIYDATGETFNINSPKQLGEVLFGKMHLPGGKKTKTGYSTAADVLEKLAPDYPVVNQILEYRQLTKLKSTYADGLAAYIRADGRIHGTFNQTITATGRISSTEPNLQNIPIRMDLGREIRKVFVPRDGSVFVDADYSQIELRVLAHMSGEEELIEAFRETQDIHRLTASQIFHVPFNEVTPLQRRNAKAVNFGIIYGISAFGLSEDLSISRQEALAYIDRYFTTYPRVKAYLDGLVSQAKNEGYVNTLFGRRRPVPELNSSNFMQRSFGERVAMNAPIQGTAADIMKIAMVKVDKRLHRDGYRARIILQVHDELVLEVPEEEQEAVSALLQEEMENAVSLKVNLDVGVGIGHSWYETK